MEDSTDFISPSVMANRVLSCVLSKSDKGGFSEALTFATVVEGGGGGGKCGVVEGGF